jgi:CBS domain-containing protein
VHKPRALAEATAADVMTSPAAYVEAETTLKEIARLMLQQNIGSLPVVDEAGNLAGIVSEGDLVRRNTKAQEPKRSWWLDLFDAGTMHSDAFLAYLERHGLRAKDVMTTEVVSVNEDTGIVEIAKLLEAHHIKRVPVVRGKRLVGIVSRSNLLQALMRAAPVHDRNQRHASAKPTAQPRREPAAEAGESSVEATSEAAPDPVGAGRPGPRDRGN